MQIAAKQSRRLAVAIGPNVEAIAGSNDLQVSIAKCLEQLSEADHRFSIEERKVKKLKPGERRAKKPKAKNQKPRTVSY
jgi:hypothetical protein